MSPKENCNGEPTLSRRRALAGFAAVWVGACLFGCKKNERAGPTPAKRKLGEDGIPHPSAEDRCPMCAMRVSDNEKWAGVIALDDGTTYYLCSVRCTLATALHPKKFLGVEAERIGRVGVPDYLHPGRSIPANDAYYVVDSDVKGPMGAALVPAKEKVEADTIVKRHGGRIIRRADVTDALLMDLKHRGRGS